MEERRARSRTSWLDRLRRRIAIWVYPRFKLLETELVTVREEALVDPVSGVNTRAAWEQFRHTEEALSLSMVIVDIDQFKKINDNHGHLTGDRVLGFFGWCLRRAVDFREHIYRYGGDEFIVYCIPGSHRQLAEHVGFLLENAVHTPELSNVPGYADEPVPDAFRDIPVVTATFGFGRTFEEADADMYAKKPDRRNRPRV